MDNHTLYCYPNSSTRNGTCMDSPPPPYTSGGDLSFVGVKFSVVGSGRKAVPCQHCRRDLGTFETLLLHSEGLKKGSVRNEVIFMVNVLERYCATGNYELADVRPPVYQMSSSSHLGAEYCRHCNQADSLTNKPQFCADTRGDTSSHNSLSDVDQFSISLDDSSSSTNKYIRKYEQVFQGDNTLTTNSGNPNQRPQYSTEPGIRQPLSRPQDYILTDPNRRTKNRKRPPSTQIKTNHVSQPPSIIFSSQSQKDDTENDSPEYIKASYPDEITSESKISRQNNKHKSMSRLPNQRDSHYPGVAPQQSEVFFAEDVKKLKDKMGSKIRDELKTDPKSSYIDKHWGRDLEALKKDLLTDPKTKNIINRLVESSIKSWISSNKDALNSPENLEYSDRCVLNKKGDIPPPLKIDACQEVELNVVGQPRETLEEKLPGYLEEEEDDEEEGQKEDILNEEELIEQMWIPQEEKAYNREQRGIDIQYVGKTTPHLIQTPGNDSGFFSPSPKFMSNLSPWERQNNDSFRLNPYDISSDFSSPDERISQKWENNQYNDYNRNNTDISREYAGRDYNNHTGNHSVDNNDNEEEDEDEVDEDNEDNDDNNPDVTNSCKSDAENYNSHKNMICESSSETATVCSTSSVFINDEENGDFSYDVANPVMSPRDGFTPSIPADSWGDFRQSLSPNSLEFQAGNASPDPLVRNATQTFLCPSGDDTQPTDASSLKKNLTSYEKIENTPLIYQESPVNFSPPRQNRRTLPSPDSVEWDLKSTNRAGSKRRASSSLKELVEQAEKREGPKLSESGNVSVAKKLNFDNSPSTQVTDDSMTALWGETDQKAPSDCVDESSLGSTPTSDQVNNQQNKHANESHRFYELSPPLPPPPPSPLLCEEKSSRRCSNSEARQLNTEPPVELSLPMKQLRRAQINDKPPQADSACNETNNKERFPLKRPDQEALTTCKARAILQSFETSTKTIGTYTPIELENVYTKSSSKNLLFTGGPFQADQNFRSWLADIVCNKHGQYIVSDWSNCCVQMFSTAGLPGDRVTFTSGPWGLALMSETVVACTVPHAKQISLLSHGSRLIIVGLVSTVRRYWGIAVTKYQNLVCSCTQGIDLLTPDGKVLRTIQYNEVGLEFFVFPQCLTIGDNGVIYVSDSCGTYLIGLPEDGDLSFSFKPLEGLKLKTPRAIEYGRDGYVYIADTDSDKIYRLTEDGTLDCELFTAADNVQGPLAITFRENKLIVTQKDSSILILPT